VIFDRRDVTPAGREADEWDTICRAVDLRQAQTLVEKGLAPSYQALGLRTADDQVPNWLLRALAYMDAVTEEALWDRGKPTP